MLTNLFPGIQNTRFSTLVTIPTNDDRTQPGGSTLSLLRSIHGRFIAVLEGPSHLPARQSQEKQKRNNHIDFQVVSCILIAEEDGSPFAQFALNARNRFPFSQK